MLSSSTRRYSVSWPTYSAIPSLRAFRTIMWADSSRSWSKSMDPILRSSATSLTNSSHRWAWDSSCATPWTSIMSRLQQAKHFSTNKLIQIRAFRQSQCGIWATPRSTSIPISPSETSCTRTLNILLAMQRQDTHWFRARLLQREKHRPWSLLFQLWSGLVSIERRKRSGEATWQDSSNRIKSKITLTSED